MWRSISALACVAVILIVMHMQVGNLMVPAPGGAPGNAQPPTWTLFSLPAKPDARTTAQKRADKKAEEEATLLRPFAKPYPFTAEKEGYKIIFPGKPTVPQFYSITRRGTTWHYSEQRLGTVTFTASWDEGKKFRPGLSDREYLDWVKNHYKDQQENRHGGDPRWSQTQHFFKFQGKYEAVEIADHFHFKNDDDYYGPQLCRHLIIYTGEDLYALEVEGNAKVVSHFTDAFFNSFELMPKVAKAK